jgi:hypothetical protein
MDPVIGEKNKQTVNDFSCYFRYLFAISGMPNGKPAFHKSQLRSS